MTTTVAPEAQVRRLRLRVEILERKIRSLEFFIQRQFATSNEAIAQLRKALRNHEHPSRVAESS